MRGPSAPPAARTAAPPRAPPPTARARAPRGRRAARPSAAGATGPPAGSRVALRPCSRLPTPDHRREAAANLSELALLLGEGLPANAGGLEPPQLVDAHPDLLEQRLHLALVAADVVAAIESLGRRRHHAASSNAGVRPARSVSSRAGSGAAGRLSTMTAATTAASTASAASA